MIEDVTKSDRGWQIAGVLLLLSIMFVVLYFAGGTQYVADHAETVSTYLSETYGEVSSYVKEFTSDESTVSTPDQTIAVTEDKDA